MQTGFVTDNDDFVGKAVKPTNRREGTYKVRVHTKISHHHELLEIPPLFTVHLKMEGLAFPHLLPQYIEKR